MPQYKLYYFDVRGAAETIRLIFAYTGVPYEDVRIKHEDWPALKPKTPFHQLPYIEIDGKPLGQSIAIARLLAKKHQLAGTTDEEQAQVDAIIDYVKDILNALVKWWFEKDEALKEKLKQEFFTTTLPAQLNVLESHLKASGKGEYFVPSGLTFADIHAAQFLYNVSKKAPTALDGHPLLKALVDRVHNLPGIKEWVAKRPNTEN